MTPDCELLHRYADARDEAAFAEVVHRHADLVYSAALRLTGGDSQLSQDVAQKVFTTLANKAADLSRHVSLTGWLHTTTRYVASVAVRGERRRQTREREAIAMEHNPTTTEADWMQLEPLLDEAVGQLRIRDREAVLLRYFQGKSHREVAMELGWNEAVARKRVERALEQLRTHFTRRGVTVSSIVLATAMTANSVQAAPIDTVKNITASSLVGSAGTIGENLMLALFSMSTKTKTIIAAAVLTVIFTALVTVRHNPASTPAQVASTQTKTPVANVAQVAAPTAPPAPQSPSAVQATTDDPQKQLSTTLADILNYLQSGDLNGMYQKYIPPDQLASMSPQEKENLQQMAQMVDTPRMQQYLKTKTALVQSVLGQSPEMNAAGDQAIYHMTPPPVPPELAKYITPDNPLNDQLQGKPIPLVLVKINGKWYLKEEDGYGI